MRKLGLILSNRSHAILYSLKRLKLSLNFEFSFSIYFFRFSLKMTKGLLLTFHDVLFRRRLLKKEPVFQALWTENVDYGQVLISPGMIEDHMPHQVLRALHRVRWIDSPSTQLLLFPHALHGSIHSLLLPLILD